MQINEGKEKNNINDILGTFTLINYFLKIFSLNCSVTKLRNGLQYGRTIRLLMPAILLGGANLFTLYYKIMYLTADILSSIKYTDALQMIYDFFQNFVDLYFVNKYGADKCLVYVNKYAYMDDLIYMKYYGAIGRKFTRILLLYVCLWMLSSISDYTIWMLSNGIIAASVYSIAYFYFFIKMLTNMNLTLHIMHVEARLSTIVDTVQTLYTHSECIVDISHDAHNRWLNGNDAGDRSQIHSARKHSSATRNVQWLCRYYLLLTEQVKFINQMFGMRMLLNSLSLFIDMVRFINMAVRIVIGSQSTDLKYYPAVATVARLIACASVLTSLVYHCEKTYGQRDSLLNKIDNLLVNKKLNEDVINKMKNFRELVQSRQISFHMANFIRIDYAFLVSTASVVSTYSIILLQSVN